jgi:CheY-like chemotaxis protein
MLPPNATHLEGHDGPGDRPDGAHVHAHGGKDSDTEAAILQSSILIVDDQAAHVHLLERLLRDTGYVNVSSTMDPRLVGALHREHGFDLILLDIQMPGLDGFGVLDELRADAPSAVLPVIVLTAQPAHKLRALQAGARDFINKPFETVEVKVRIHHMLEVHLLNKKLETHNRDLERTVQERTAELQKSEARFRSLTDLAVDWYWEQDDAGQLTLEFGPVMELLGITNESLAASRSEGSPADVSDHDHPGNDANGADQGIDQWDAAERKTLNDNIKARQPFLDFVMSRRRADGSQQQFRISGEPMFDRTCRFTGYRGLGVEVLHAPRGLNGT